ncbi:hypothetical protein Leryth_013626 [Lithospermum erythrorhizon]|nr:hypothetical protein Leryth_013626 [Lithospermum erythrorhizon]
MLYKQEMFHWRITMVWPIIVGIMVDALDNNDCSSEIAFFVMEQVSEEVKTFLAQLKQFDHRIIYYSIENMRQSPHMKYAAFPPFTDEKIAAYLAREKSNIPNNCEPLKGIDIGGVKHLSYEQLKEWTHNFTNDLLDDYIEYGKLFELNTQEFTGAILKTFQLLYPHRSYYKLHPARLHNELMAFSIKGLTHPNLPKLIGYSCDNLLAVVYGDLRPKLHMFDAIESDDFAWKDRMKAALQLADLIRFMHSNGIVVCTIAKENMLIDENDDVKLLSIGLHAHDDYEKAQVPADYFQRSYGCSAPEIALGMFTAKTDIYAYGILLLELVSKQTADIFMPHLYVDDAKKLQAGGRPSLVHESFQVADAIGSKLTSLALYCVHGNPASRPVISEVFECLQEQCKDLGNGLSKSLQEWQEGAVGEGSQTKKMKLVK